MRTPLFVLLLLALCPAVAAATPEVSADLEAYSVYLWRGFLLCDSPVVQPSVTVSSGATALNVWGNFDRGGEGCCTETDYTLSHDFPLSSLSGTAGFTYYTFPNLDTGRRSREAFLGATREGAVPVTLTGYYDFGEGKGLYAELGTEAPVTIGGREGSLSVALGYNRHQWREETGFSHVQLALSASVPLGSATLTPVVGYAKALASDFGSRAVVGVQVSLAVR